MIHGLGELGCQLAMAFAWPHADELLPLQPHVGECGRFNPLSGGILNAWRVREVSSTGLCNLLHESLGVIQVVDVCTRSSSRVSWTESMKVPSRMAGTSLLIPQFHHVLVLLSGPTFNRSVDPLLVDHKSALVAPGPIKDILSSSPLRHCHRPTDW
jgi:hypothetical protein